MPTLGTTILTSVIAGLVTSVIVLSFSAYWRGVIYPWLENLVYRGVRIEGVWKTEMKVLGETKNEIVVLKQRAHKVLGTITYPEDTQGYSHTYQLQGVFFDNVLTAMTEEIGRGRLDRGTLVLTIQPGLSTPTMKGLGVWFDGTQPIAAEYKWYRE